MSMLALSFPVIGGARHPQPDPVEGTTGIFSELLPEDHGLG
jgi:hypothetical protein